LAALLPSFNLLIYKFLCNLLEILLSKNFHQTEKIFVVKMYSLVIPEELVKELYSIKKKTKVSIRKQILDSVKNHIKRFKGDINA